MSRSAHCQPAATRLPSPGGDPLSHETRGEAQYMRSWGWGFCALACAWTLATAGNALAAPPQPEMSSAVAQVAAVAARQGTPAALDTAEATGLDVRSGLVHVVVQSASQETLAASAAVVSSGGRVDASS